MCVRNERCSDRIGNQSQRRDPDATDTDARPESVYCRTETGPDRMRRNKARARQVEPTGYRADDGKKREGSSIGKAASVCILCVYAYAYAYACVRDVMMLGRGRYGAATRR